MISEIIVKTFMKENKTLLIVYLFILFITIPLEIYYLPNSLSTFISTLTSNQSIDILFNNIVMIVGILIISQVGVLLRALCENTIIPKFVVFTRKWIYKYIILNHQKQIENLPLGKVISVLSDLPHIIKGLLVTGVRMYLPYMVSFIFIICYFFYKNKYLGILQLLTLLIIIIIFYIKGRVCVNLQSESHTNYLSLTESVQDTLNNLMSIYTSQTENKELKTHKKKEEINEKYYLKSLNCSLNIEYYTNTVIVISFIIFNYLIFKFLKEKKLDNKEIINLYICEIYYWIIVLRRLQNNIGDSINNLGSMNSISDFLKSMIGETRNNLSDENKKVSAKEVFNKNDNIVIEMKNVTFRYPSSNFDIVNDLNLTIKSGERVWLLGHSGIGKSTITKLIMGLITPNKGDILIGSDKINSKTGDISKVRKEITFLNQDTKLFNSSVYENMIYGSKVSKDKVLKLLKKININIFNKLSKGIDSNVGVGGGSMSGGQRQVILLFRTYFRDTNIIIMDEPISAIDFDSMPMILKVIKHISKDKTLIVISHNDNIKSLITRTIDLNIINKQINTDNS
jgi:ABC-type bacteriocin/lantibiotic exporter with double-glycine peptidase domain